MSRKIKILNECSFSIENEDHTLLNPLKHVIDTHIDNIEFCGYTIPHPSEELAIFTVQSKNEENQNFSVIKRTINEGCDMIGMYCDKLINLINKV
ncbi:RPAC2 [Hepatospora eriocheir]|uniref:RPAC2 n=1 Tax=Hepatospora eriocheir TaxID=1081669 RepID=A0A1X0QAR0_9MICR|nr:RPAC2 [Hepatospora eriocheir]